MSATKNRGLGRGLDAIFGTSAPVQQSKPMTEMAEVAEWRQITENTVDSASQKAIYTIVSTRNAAARATSSQLGGIPIIIRP